MSDPFVLETQSLVKEFKGFVAVDDVNLKVQRGHIHALIGPNGAGKTTVFNLLTKFLIPTRGKILFKGEDITSMKSAAIARKGVVRSFQISAVFPHMTALENIRVALQSFEGNSFRFWKSGESLNKLNERCMELLDSVGLTEFANTTTVELAYGRKRALELATTLAMEPELLLQGRSRPHGADGGTQPGCGQQTVRPGHRAGTGGRAHRRRLPTGVR